MNKKSLTIITTLLIPISTLLPIIKSEAVIPKYDDASS